MKPAVKSAAKPRAPRGSKKISVTEKCREILVHAKLGDDGMYSLYLYSKLHHWAEILVEYAVDRCLDISLAKTYGLDISLIPTQGCVLSIAISEDIIAFRAARVAPPGATFLCNEISSAKFHESTSDPYLICLIDQLPEAVPTKPITIKQEEELLDLPF